MITFEEARRVLYIYLKELNFYTADSTGDHEIRNGRISTLAILTTYTLSNYEPRTIVIVNSSLLVDEEIRAKFGSDQLSCPCNEMFIDYGLFSSVEPISHPICSSIFIEKAWFDFLESFNTIALESAFAYNTFRRSFNLLRIPHNYQATIVSMGKPPPFVKYYNVKDLRFSEGDVDQMTSCSCDREPYCKTHLVILPESNDYGNSTGVFLIPHLLTGCDFVNTLMASTLDYFFNQSCLDRIQNTRISTTKYTTLRPSLSFPSNTTIQTIVDQMFIETWYSQHSTIRLTTIHVILSLVLIR